MPDIQYKFAKDSDGRALHIEDAPPRSRSQWDCFGCDGKLRAQKGNVRSHHFHHIPPFNGKCSPETALHKTAKALVQQGFSDALLNETKYLLGLPCNRSCGRELADNIAIPGATIKSEQYVIPNVKSDLVLMLPGQEAPIALEVVVTHPMDSHTRERYVREEILVFSKKFNEESDLAGLESRFIADEALIVSWVCDDCRQEIKAVALRDWIAKCESAESRGRLLEEKKCVHSPSQLLLPLDSRTKGRSTGNRPDNRIPVVGGITYGEALVRAGKNPRYLKEFRRKYYR